MMLALSKLLAFIRRDFLIDASYKLAFIQRMMYTITPLVLIFFFDKLISLNPTVVLAEYGNKYFSFAVVGLCFSNFFNIALETYKAAIRRAQMTGCLEAILSSQTNTRSIILMSSVYSFAIASLNLVIAGIALLFFDFNYADANLLGTLVVVMVSIFLFISLGIISSAFIIMFKRGDPLGFFLGTISAFLGGAFFPISVLPDWLQKISIFIPIRYTLDAVRLTLLKGYSLKMIHNELFVLISLAIILLPLSLLSFQYALTRGKKDGSIMQY